jgi:hypothetical protein
MANAALTRLSCAIHFESAGRIGKATGSRPIRLENFGRTGAAMGTLMNLVAGIALHTCLLFRSPL